ncbi:MAG: MBL fold metallo-hydrolase [Oscillospiraceae bacterium]|nr:MBL fold metallo-hydrolase [Oscillospiraceae bacterium]
MEHNSISVTVLGARGSVPVSGKSFSRYGGATTCALFCACGQYVVIDAGTGLMSLPEEAMLVSPLPLLLTHAHVDHLLGLPLSSCTMRKGFKLDIYAANHSGLNAQEQVESLLSPPLWPVGPAHLPADIAFHELKQTMSLGAVGVKTLAGRHPGGVSLLRLEAAGKSAVFATDCTLDDGFLPRFAEFIKGCDLLLCDGQYCDEEWKNREHFGHNSWEFAARFAQEQGVERLRIIHHDPRRTDEQLEREAEKLRPMGADYDFAKEGETIAL